MNSYDIICDYVPQSISIAMKKVPLDISSKVDEVRIRTDRPVNFIMSGKALFLCRNGQVTANPNSENTIGATQADIENIFMRLCKYSVHSSSAELQQGFFTIRNGIRVGMAGIYSPSSSSVKKATSFNFRVSRELKGCGSDIYNRLLSTNNSVLICGKTNSGKTTVLRDLCRLCGNNRKIALVDERHEIAAMSDCTAQLDVGPMTDIISDLSRFNAIISAIRTLSPEYIFCDEISTAEDCDAILSGHGCGVKFVSTAHAASIADLKKRESLKRLLDEKVFDYAVFLFDEHLPGRVCDIRRLT